MLLVLNAYTEEASFFCWVGNFVDETGNLARDAALEAQARCAYHAVCNAYGAAKKQLSRQSPAPERSPCWSALIATAWIAQLQVQMRALGLSSPLQNSGGSVARNATQPSSVEARASTVPDATDASLRTVSPEWTLSLECICWSESMTAW